VLGSPAKLIVVKPAAMAYKILLACLILTSCSTSRMTETNLYFGQTRPDGSMITENEWQNFRETRLDKVFKAGSSTLKVIGTWLDPDTHKQITEPSYLVIHHYKRSSQMSQQIDSLVYWYKKMFAQQAVLRVDKKVKASF
jgi:hypothetical protein